MILSSDEKEVGKINWVPSSFSIFSSANGSEKVWISSKLGLFIKSEKILIKDFFLKKNNFACLFSIPYLNKNWENLDSILFKNSKEFWRFFDWYFFLEVYFLVGINFSSFKWEGQYLCKCLINLKKDK